MPVQTLGHRVAVPSAPTPPCPTCQHLQFTNSAPTILKLGEITTSAKNGCSCCSILETGISAYLGDVPNLVEMLDKRGMKFSWSTHRNTELIVNLRYWGDLGPEDYDFGVLYLSFYFPKEEIGIPISSTIQPDLCSDYSNPESHKRLVQHLQACDRDHSCLESPSSQLPTRVIEVGHESSQSNNLVRLRSSLKSEQGRYLILSHCWGEQPAFDRVEEMKTGLSLDALPITFRDAVKLTRLLGVPYLWIDSICIDQNNGDDWVREARKMAGYYANAYLTVAAACAPDTQSGFLKSTGRRRIRIINCVTSDGHMFDIAVKEHSSKYILEISERGDPLYGRGWVFQEFLLSPRIIAYSKLEMEWYCRDIKGDWCECLDLWPKTHGEIVSKPHSSFWRSCRHALAAKSSDGWQAIVNEYSRRALKKDSDRLLALDSVASHFGSPSDTSYIGGTWSLQEDMLTSLQWKTRRPAPSWTWASIEGSVDVKPLHKCDQGVTVIQAPMAALGDNHSVDASASVLRLSGSLIKARLDVVNARPLKWSDTPGRDIYWFTALPTSAGSASSIGNWARDEEKGHNNPRIMFAPDTPFEPGPVLSDCLTDSPMRVTFRRANKCLDDIFHQMSGVVYCLRFSPNGNGSSHISMLILSRIDGPSGNVYERLGVAWVWRSEDTAAFFTAIEPTAVNVI